jgi:hypothetical protein
MDKLFSDFVTKPSFDLTCRENLLSYRAKICPRLTPRRQDAPALMCGLLNSSGPTRSQAVDSFDCKAMWGLNTKREARVSD